MKRAPFAMGIAAAGCAAVPGFRAPAMRIDFAAFNDECDVVVVLGMLRKADATAAAPAVIAFLNTPPVVLWAKKELDLEFVRRE